MNTAQDDFVTVIPLINDIESVLVLSYLSVCVLLWRTRKQFKCIILDCSHRQFLAFSVACEKSGQRWTTPLKRCYRL